MNREKMMELSDFVESKTFVECHIEQFDADGGNGDVDNFNMNEWRCGTTACIGGHADILFSSEAYSGNEVLGLKYCERDYLFFGKTMVPHDDLLGGWAEVRDWTEEDGFTWLTVTPERAALEIRSMVMADVVGELAH